MGNGHRATTLSLTDDQVIEEAATTILGGKRGELLKFILAGLVSGLVSYLGAYYGLRERLAVLETKVEYTQRAIDRVEATVDHIRGGNKP